MRPASFKRARVLLSLRTALLVSAHARYKWSVGFVPVHYCMLSQCSGNVRSMQRTFHLHAHKRTRGKRSMKRRISNAPYIS